MSEVQTLILAPNNLVASSIRSSSIQSRPDVYPATYIAQLYRFLSRGKSLGTANATNAATPRSKELRKEKLGERSVNLCALEVVCSVGSQDPTAHLLVDRIVLG